MCAKISFGLLQHRADANVGCDEHGHSPLFAAVMWDNEEVVRRLLAAGADPNGAGADKFGRGVLSQAVRANQGRKVGIHVNGVREQLFAFISVVLYTKILLPGSFLH